MQRIHHFAITLAGTCGLLLLGCQPSTTQSEPPVEEGATPEQQQPVETMPPEEPSTEEEEIGQGMPEEEPMAAGELTPEAEQFIQDAALVNMAEIELSRSVMSNIKDPTVRDYAQRMIDDHGRIHDELKTLASGLGATLPMEMPESVNQKKDELMKLQGKKLETRYIEIMVDDHDKAVELFRDMSEQEGVDPQLQRFANSNLPVLQEHLDRAKAIQEGKPYTGPQARAPKAKAPRQMATKR